VASYSAGAIASERPTQVRKLILALACGISFLLYLHRYSWGMIKKDVAREFHWDPVALGWLDTLFTAPYGAAQVPSGMLCDWFGAHAFLSGTIGLWSLALGATALAGGYTSMALARVTFGAAQAGCYPVLNKVSKNWFPFAQRTTAQSWIATFFGRAGGAASFFVFGTVLLGWWGLPWRWAIGLFTLLGMACGLAFLILFRNTPREHPWANEAEARLIVADDVSAAQATRAQMPWTRLARSGTFRFMLCRAFCSNMADVFYVYWVPMFLLEEKGLPPAQAGWLSALPLIGGALGGLASGRMQTWLIRATGNRRWARSGVGLAGKLSAALCVLVSLALADPLAVAGALLVVKFFSDWDQTAEWGTITDIGGRATATLFGCINTAGSLGGAVASPLIGLLLSSYQVKGVLTTEGWTAVFLFVAGAYVLAAGCWPFIDCRRSLEGAPVADSPRDSDSTA
jgi:ACS family glucarate transporter-like MFS transporter